MGRYTITIKGHEPDFNDEYYDAESCAALAVRAIIEKGHHFESAVVDATDGVVGLQVSNTGEIVRVVLGDDLLTATRKARAESMASMIEEVAAAIMENLGVDSGQVPAAFGALFKHSAQPKVSP